VLRGGEMDKIIVVHDKNSEYDASPFHDVPYEKLNFSVKINAHLIVYVSEQNQEVTIIKNRWGSNDDPKIISFLKIFTR